MLSAVGSQAVIQLQNKFVKPLLLVSYDIMKIRRKWLTQSVNDENSEWREQPQLHRVC